MSGRSVDGFGSGRYDGPLKGFGVVTLPGVVGLSLDGLVVGPVAGPVDLVPGPVGLVPGPVGLVGSVLGLLHLGSLEPGVHSSGGKYSGA